jgi:hypothetical protein
MGAVLLASIIAALCVAPVAQDPAYHRFADTRALLGIANFWNVVSNIPLLIVGIGGLVVLRGARGVLPELRLAYRLFFVGALLIACGSAWYHRYPDNASLDFDRLPMTVSFMAFLVIVAGETMSARVARRLLVPLIVLGIASVLYWHVTEAAGHGDLRPYALVQFVPMILIPLMLVGGRPLLTGTGYLWGVVALYGLAKGLELADARVYELGWGVSGHALKHVVSAAAVGLVAVAVRRRSGLTGAEPVR